MTSASPSSSDPTPTGLAARLEFRRDRVALLFLLLAVIAAWLPVWVFALCALGELAALTLALRHARRLAPAQRSAMTILGHITAVAAGSLVCVFFISRYVHYISFQTQVIASVLLIGALAFLLLLRRPVH